MGPLFSQNIVSNLGMVGVPLPRNFSPKNKPLFDQFQSEGQITY
jgi:hypothetical protein